MKILFICTANRIRSRGAKKFFSEHAPQHEFDSAGTRFDWVQETRDLGGVFQDAKWVTQELIDWADLVVCMEEEHALTLKKELNLNKPTDIWDMPDIFDPEKDGKLDPNLERHFQKMLERFGDNLFS